MTGLRSQRSMKKGSTPTPFCSELRLFSREAITLKNPLLRTHDLAAEGDLKTSRMTKVPRFRHYCTAFSF
jgi:hypothetical protein